MFEKDANDSFNCKKVLYKWETDKRSYIDGFKDGAEFGYNKANEEHEGKCKTAYIKGIRTMANALKDYDRTDGAWTDYFEHTVDNVLKKLLGQDIKDESQEAYKELCENYSSNKSLYTDGFSDGYKECQKEHEWHYVKDEGTPIHEGHYLVCLRNKNHDILDCWILFDKDVGWYSLQVRLVDIYAWKEIVLPELKESE